MKKQGLILFSDSSRGVYIPKHFASEIKRDCIRPQSGEFIADIDDLLDWFIDVDPYTEDFYWDEWIAFVEKIELVDGDHIFRLHHDGDLWLYCEELMTEQEKIEFFGEWE